MHIIAFIFYSLSCIPRTVIKFCDMFLPFMFSRYSTNYIIVILSPWLPPNCGFYNSCFYLKLIFRHYPECCSIYLVVVAKSVDDNSTSFSLCNLFLSISYCIVIWNYFYCWEPFSLYKDLKFSLVIVLCCFLHQFIASIQSSFGAALQNHCDGNIIIWFP